MKRSPIQSAIRTSLIVSALAVAMLGQVPSAQAQYANPPMWMPMTMLNASFDTTTLTLSVVDQATKLGVGVYPVLNLATNGMFDPAQPWGVLNGTEYSRRLGWDDANRRNPDTSTHILNLVQATYGSGASLWIECLNKSSGLESYLAVGRYGINADNTLTIDPAANGYSGIFGTAGSSTKWQWDGMMDHNTYAVDLADITSPGQFFSATYRVYVGDALGNEILNPDFSSASTLETWTWQAIPEPTTLSLAAVGLIGLLTFRRSKS